MPLEKLQNYSRLVLIKLNKVCFCYEGVCLHNKNTTVLKDYMYIGNRHQYNWQENSDHIKSMLQMSQLALIAPIQLQ